MQPPNSTLKIAPGGTIIQSPPSERFAGKFGVGEVLAGLYRIDRRIGEGGMSVVLAATHLPTGQVMAVKLLQQETASAEGAVARFWREARLVSRLQNPHVVKIFDVGMLADDTPYMAMELLQGETLAERMTRVGKMSLDEAKGYLAQACDAVMAAHAIGVIHRWGIDDDLENRSLVHRNRPQRALPIALDGGSFDPLTFEPGSYVEREMTTRAPFWKRGPDVAVCAVPATARLGA